MAQLHAVPQQTLLAPGERLALARQRAGYTPGQFAAKLDMHRNNVSRWERQSRPSRDTIERYVEICGNTTEEWLMFEIGEWPTIAERPDGSPNIQRYTNAAWAA